MLQWHAVVNIGLHIIAQCVWLVTVSFTVCAALHCSWHTHPFVLLLSSRLSHSHDSPKQLQFALLAETPRQFMNEAPQASWLFSGPSKQELMGPHYGHPYDNTYTHMTGSANVRKGSSDIQKPSCEYRNDMGGYHNVCLT